MAAATVCASTWLALACLAAAAAMPGASATPPSAADLAHCPKSCGGVNISYPYGIGPGCFRPGFEVTCNGSTRPPKLFLGNTTTEIIRQYPDGYVQASIVFNIDTKPGAPATTYNTSWEAPGRSLRIMQGYNVMMVIVGCGVEAYLFDTTDPSDVLGYCASMCGDMAALEKEAEGRDCNGMGCCEIEFQRSVRAFRLAIIQKEEALPASAANATVKAFLQYKYSANSYNFSMVDLMSDKVNASTIGAVWAYLSPVITDQPNCRTAQLHEQQYACAFASCTDYVDEKSGGYSCTCPDEFNDGNPYLVDGCIQEYNSSNEEKLNCSRSCGNTSIPLPFGFEPGCSVNKKFQLNCSSNQPLIGPSHAQYQVANISVDEGLLFVNKSIDPQDGHTRMIALYLTSDGFVEELIDLSNFDFSEQYGIWKWAISNTTCDMAKNQTRSYACISANSECTTVTHGLVYIGYRCKCSLGYEGNPYVRNGCNGIYIHSVSIVFFLHSYFSFMAS